jgi:hypothetical protein
MPMRWHDTPSQESHPHALLRFEQHRFERFVIALLGKNAVARPIADMVDVAAAGKS